MPSPIKPPTIPSLFVTATGTEVGKTLVSCAILDALHRAGHRALPIKPFATGCRSRAGKRIAEDATALAKAARATAIPHETICPIRLRTPAAPIESLRIEKRTSRCAVAPINRAITSLCKQTDYLLIEGVGGVEVPLCSAGSFGLKRKAPATVIDLIRALRCPALVVAHASLGTINHTVLTINALKRARIPIAGVVLNFASPKRTDPTIKTNARWITEMTGVPVLAHFPTLRTAFDPSRIPPATQRAADQLNPAALFK